MAASLGALGFVVVLVANGALPGMVPSAASAFVLEGRMRCLANSGASALRLWCEGLGEPFGYPILTGGPVVGIGALFMRLLGTSSSVAYTSVSMLFLFLAMAGGFGLLRRLAFGRLLAIGVSAVYLISPTVLGMHGFGGTFYGFALLPTYVWADLVLTQAIEQGRRRSILVGIAAFLFLRLVAVFMDGYSFVASGMVSLTLWTFWSVRANIAPHRRILGPVAALATNALAVSAYLAHAPSNYARAPLALFRSMGLDVATLWIPSSALWLSDEFGWTLDSTLWGDGTNSTFNYVGYGCLALAVVSICFGKIDWRVGAVLAAGVIALVLSFGPAIKVLEERAPIEGIPTYESYLMPEGLAPETLWADLFIQLPGIQSMRATYRWFGVTRLALLVSAGLGVSYLVRRGGWLRVAAAIVGTIAVIEISPDIVHRSNNYRQRYGAVQSFSSEVEADIRKVASAGQKTFFLNHDGSHNDWLVNYLAPAAGLVAFNAGGDKNLALSRPEWPKEIKELAASDATAQDALTAFESGVVDVIIVPFFHLREAAYSWPPPEEERLSVKKSFEPVLDDVRFEVQMEKWFALITMKPVS